MRPGLISLVALAACSGAGSQRLGEFDVSWSGDPVSLEFKRTDGSVLLRTAGVALDVRTSTPTWEMQFGSYKVTEDDAPWAGATSLSVDEATEAGVRLNVEHEDGTSSQIRAAAFPGGLKVTLAGPAGVNRVRWHFACAADDHFLGFGAQADAVDHRGHRLPMWVSEPGIGKTELDDIDPADPLWFLTGTRHASSYPMPSFLSNRGFAFLAQTTRRAIFDLCQAKSDEWSVEAWADGLEIKLFDGPAPAKAIERLTAETGRQPLPNDLAFAVWNDAIFGSAKVREVAKLLRDEHIPSSAIWTEDFRGGNFDAVTGSYRLEEEWDVDRTLYPDVEALATELHDEGFRWFAYHNTFLTNDTKILAEARAKDVLVKKQDGSEYLFTGVKFVPSGLVDLSNPAGEQFVIDKLKHLLSLGFDGWMADFAEWLPPDAKLANGDAEALHNEYPTAYHAAVEKALAGADPRLSMSFSRSGTLGTVVHQPVVWAGDQYTNFAEDDGMPTVVTMGLNFGLAGISTYGHDIAGYQNGTLPPSTKECFFRWTSLGALSPVMRTHHGTKAKENWWFGKDADTIAHFRRWARFHTQLWPYFRLAAEEARDHGLPIMRQLALAFPDDAAAWTMKDEYLLGPALLVAPVLKEGATSRSVHLPAGRWIPWFSGEPVDGGRDLTVDVPITEAAMWVRPGTIVPMLPDRVETLVPAGEGVVDLDDVRGERELHVFAGANGTITDLDGSTYTLTSAKSEAPTEVRAGADVLPACGEEMVACAIIDAASRTVRVRGANLTSVVLANGSGTVLELAATGAAKVTGVVARW